MKKCWLFISLLFFFFTGSVHADGLPGMNSIAQIECSNYSAPEAGYPHTECEVLQHSASASSHSRQQDPAYFNHLIYPALSRGFCVTRKTEHQCIFPFKKYLSHIYPSHNFW